MYRWKDVEAERYGGNHGHRASGMRSGGFIADGAFEDDERVDGDLEYEAGGDMINPSVGVDGCGDYIEDDDEDEETGGPGGFYFEGEEEEEEGEEEDYYDDGGHNGHGFDNYGADWTHYTGYEDDDDQVSDFGSDTYAEDVFDEDTYVDDDDSYIDDGYNDW